MSFQTTKKLTVIWFFALLLNAFSVTVFAEISNNSAEMVYCPLTKKLQPVKVQKKTLLQNPLENICADEKNKKSFSDRLFISNPLKRTFLDEKQFENLAFDFFQQGKTAFQNLPSLPNFPRKNLIKISSVIIAFSKPGEMQFVWKSQSADFSFAQNPRPPNSASVISFESKTPRKLDVISRRIVPRAPPIFFS